MECASAAQVLAEAGPDGLSVGEIVRRIQSSGLRDLRSSRNPDASVSGALARDVIFWKVSPARFALHAVVAHHRCKRVRGWMTVASRGQLMCLLGRSVGHAVTLCSCHNPWSDRGEPAVTAEHTRTALQARQQTQHMLLQLLQSRRMHQRPQPSSSSPTAMRR